MRQYFNFLFSPVPGFPVSVPAAPSLFPVLHFPLWRFRGVPAVPPVRLSSPTYKGGAVAPIFIKLLLFVVSLTFFSCVALKTPSEMSPALSFAFQRAVLSK